MASQPGLARDSLLASPGWRRVRMPPSKSRQSLSTQAAGARWMQTWSATGVVHARVPVRRRHPAGAKGAQIGGASRTGTRISRTVENQHPAGTGRARRRQARSTAEPAITAASWTAASSVEGRTGNASDESRRSRASPGARTGRHRPASPAGGLPRQGRTSPASAYLVFDII
jgi:hypothetical protein